MKKTRMQPRVEVLEDRWAPALLLQLDGSGNLTGIFGVPSGDVSVTFTADDTVNVDEGINDLGTYSAPGNLTISLGNSVVARTLTVDFLTAAASMSGSLSISMGNNLAGYTVDMDGSAGVSTIGGTLKINSGSGPDVVTMTDMTVGGSTAINLGAGVDNTTIDPTVIDGNLSVTNSNLALVDSDVGGHCVVCSTDGQAMTVSLDVDSSVAGNVTISTGAGGDAASINAAIAGSVVVSMGNGVNSLNAPVGDAFNVVGSVTATDGAGGSIFFFDGVIGGNVTASMGNGNDSVFFGGDPVVGGLTVSGRSILLNMGNGNDLFQIGPPFGVTAPGARLNALMGNGNDTIDWSGASTIVLASATLDGGNGVDTLLPAAFALTFPTTIRNIP